jgi:hypothetical protein
MTSVINLFSNSNDLTKNKSITDAAAEYKAKKLDLNTQTPALSQGEKFKKYQNKIKKNLEKKIGAVNSKEGFQGLQQIQNNLKLNPNGLTTQSINIINNNDYSSQQQTISNLQQEYQNTLTEYENLAAQVSGSTTGYLNRVNPNNPYLNKTIQFTTGHIAYVTNQGVVKYIPSMDIWNSVSAPKQFTPVNIPWDNSWNNNVGAEIPTTPPLIAGTFMTQGQSLGNEGSNIFVSSMINNPTSTYQGCYADNTTSPLMTFIGGAPPPPVGNLQNGNFEQPQIANNSYQYITSGSAVPGWYFSAVIANNSTAWGYPMPYPNGNQCLSIQTTQYVAQTLYLQSGGQYTITFVACGRNCCDGSGQSNPINIQLYTTNNQYISNIFSFQPPVNAWTNYSTTFTVQNSQNYQIFFSGTWTAGDRSTAIQNIQLSSTGTSSSNGSYTYEQCQNAAVDEGYQYFALQNVNPATSQGYCAVSNSQPSATSLGEGMTPSGQVALWASNTANSETSNPGVTATLTNTGALSVLNSGSQSVFSTDTTNANPGNYLGCYNDCYQGRGLPTILGSGETYETCQSQAQAGNWSYFGIQYTQPNGTSECWVGNDIANGMKMGKATNCTTVNGGPVGGSCSNAIYNNTSSTSNYFLILQDDGNLCIYRGTSPNDNQGYIWCSMTNGQQQQANPIYAAANGKYGQNWIAQGSTLAAGDFVGSTSGNMALIMQSDGNLVLYTFTLVENCQKMADGNTGGGAGANALYDIGKVGIQGDLSQVAYIDQNSELHSYPSTNTQYSNTYTNIPGTNSAYSDIPGAAYGGATVEQCQTSCNNNPECAGFVMSAQGNICWPKNSGMYPNGARQIDSNSSLYIRGKTPIAPPIGVSPTVNNTDTITYSNYINGGAVGNSYGLANATSTQKQQLDQLQSKMNLLSSQINTLTGQFGTGSQQAETQSEANVQGIQGYLQGLQTTNNQITNFNTNVERILSDSDIVVLQKNYNYLFWSILAAGTVLVTMNIVKK